MTSAGLLCTAASQPLITSLAVVWIPIIVFTAITGFMMRNVLVMDRNDQMMTFADNDTRDERTNIMINMDAESLQSLLEQKEEIELSRFYDSQRNNLNRISF